MSSINYGAEAELFPARRRSVGGGSIGYRRFNSLAKAVQFAMEDLPRELLLGTYLETDDERRYDGAGIRALYEHEAYPLKKPTKVR
jgi:hypothetical protein